MFANVVLLLDLVAYIGTKKSENRMENFSYDELMYLLIRQ